MLSMKERDRWVIVLLIVAGVIVVYGVMELTGMTSYEMGFATGAFVREKGLLLLAGLAVVVGAVALLRR